MSEQANRSASAREVFGALPHLLAAPYIPEVHGDLDDEPGPCRDLHPDDLATTPGPVSAGRPSNTERSYWVAIADALNAAAAAGMPVGIDLDGTLTDRRAWSVIWDRDAERWAVAGYEADDAEVGYVVTQQCGHDDYHDGHEWADQPHRWCPGHSVQADVEAWVAAWNEAHPPGTRVVAYPGCRPEDDPTGTRLDTVTRSQAWVLGGHTPVVMVDGHAAAISLTHVDVVAAEAGEGRG